jgi:hypothetical protein
MEIKPQAVVIPKETDQLEQWKYGAIFPKTPACYGFTMTARLPPWRGPCRAERHCGTALLSVPPVAGRGRE